MHAQDLHTGRRILLPHPVPPGWFATTGGNNWDPVKLTALLRRPTRTSTDVFLCALADNQDQFYPDFERIFILTLDETVLRRRLRERTTSIYGQDPGELSDIFLHHRHFERSLIGAGATPINAEPTISAVVDKILKHLAVSGPAPQR